MPKQFIWNCWHSFFVFNSKTFEIQRFIDKVEIEKARSPWKVNALLDI
jgi:hypothetical protein